MKRTLLAIVAVAVLILGAGAPGATAQTRRAARIEREMETDCQFSWLADGVWTYSVMMRTVDCVLGKWPVTSGGKAKVVCVGDRESHWNRFVTNHGRYLGLFQHAASAWAGRVRQYGPASWRDNLKTAWWNPRTQIVVTVRMERDLGWGPWAGTASRC